ncbi:MULTISPECIES: aminotransferase class III-fold pyridoxal phosphate-dependent enzyme [Mesorhizobium]|uniref:aspartate aminotransferase family protein n=1 Tax=Mesorhizobium TaxID=68287 RepID=UPI0008015FEF|nr:MULTISPECIES: aminotransferase class III-fold pyridoxal phosphate-dependent enzyme [Mesorhizobium]MUT27213.1 aminotransferase class III-fold pyridoxal phosphate-dependent enzyme [Mesorhizobium japonicum]OBQ84922.1 aminotransferase class III [Mesorhizobium sp. WSM3873]
MQRISGLGHNRGEVVGPKSREEFQRALKITRGGSMRAAQFFAPHPPYAVAGAGSWITDADGSKVFDCANNSFSLIHGHAFPPVIEALHKVLDDGTAFGLPTTSETRLAEAITTHSPKLEQVRFTSSGTEAVMFAVKAARAITGRPMIAKFEGAYHGAYDYVEVSLDSAPDNWGDSSPNSVLYASGTPASTAADVLVLPYNEAKSCRELIRAHHERLAAILLDPVAPRVGMVPIEADLREVIQDCCNRYGILLVVDEVVSYRVGFRGAHDIFGFEPDLVALGKIIGGGLPVGAVAGPASYMAVFDHTRGKPAVFHGGTFSANPLSMTAGLAALRSYTKDAVDRLNQMGETLRSEIIEQLRRRKLPAQVTGASSLFRLHLKTGVIRNYRTSFPSALQKAALAKVHLAMLQRRFLMTTNCSGALSTPMSETDVQDLAAALVDAVHETWNQSPWV